MLLFVQIDLSGADLPLFETYESRVLALLGRHGGRLEARLRSTDSRSEVHILEFPDAAALAAFRADPERMAAQDLWERCGASSVLTEMTRLPV
jgi:uncharacterized protein (DUF1330 family)